MEYRISLPVVPIEITIKYIMLRCVNTYNYIKKSHFTSSALESQTKKIHKMRVHKY